MSEAYGDSRGFAETMDAQDPLRDFRDQFHIPLSDKGMPGIYLCGNSLGLMPKAARAAVDTEVQAWADMGVAGYFKNGDPWVRYNENMREDMARIVGAKLPSEVVVMNTLTVNLHLMMVSFYRPNGKRTKILVEGNAFPSDRQAVDSQIYCKGYDPAEHVIEMLPRTGEHTIRTEDILQIIEARGEEIALVMIGAVNYYSGQFFDLSTITKAAHEKGCVVGFDLAHAVGNIPMNLHNDEIDFAVWCNYKYLNGGPACPGGVFVHEKHTIGDNDLPRFCGWWGEDLEERFKMTSDFVPSAGASAWQLSNAAVFSLAPLRESLKIFSAANMDRIREKSLKLSGYCLYLLHDIQDDNFEILTPENDNERGAQISIGIHKNGRAVFNALQSEGVICDWREPEVIRIAPVPLYNSYQDVYNFVAILRQALAALV